MGEKTFVDFEAIGVSAEKVEQLKKAIREAVRDNRLTCTQARKLAEDFDVPYRGVGQLADELQIKIRHCELGCF